MSHWSTSPDKASTNHVPHYRDMLRASVEGFSKAYGGVHLITDKIGSKELNFVEWASVDEGLEDLPKEYQATWSLGKLKAYNIISQKGEPFFHVDGDFFINQKLPSEIESSKILFQNTEYVSPINNYVSELFRKKCVKKFLINSETPTLLEDIENKYKLLNKNGILTNTGYNCGIVGGSDLEYFYQYSQRAIQTVLHPANLQLWTSNSENVKKLNSRSKPWTLAILAEQYIADIVACIMNRSPSFLTSDFNIHEDIRKWVDQDNTEFKWLHLLGHYKLYYHDICIKRKYIKEKHI